MWRFGVEDLKLWKQLLVVKYGVVGGRWRTKPRRGTHGCSLWKGIMAGGKPFTPIFILMWVRVIRCGFGMIDGVVTGC